MARRIRGKSKVENKSAKKPPTTKKSPMNLLLPIEQPPAKLPDPVIVSPQTRRRITPVQESIPFMESEASGPLKLRALTQLGEPDPSEVTKNDILTAISFNQNGEILSVGDHGGRVICFGKDLDENGQEDYGYITEFQAFHDSFDVLTSQEISKEITNIEWLKFGHQKNPSVICSNANSAKLFRLVNKPVYKSESAKKRFILSKGLCIPKRRHMADKMKNKHVCTYTTGTEKNVHSIS